MVFVGGKGFGKGKILQVVARQPQHCVGDFAAAVRSVVSRTLKRTAARNMEATQEAFQAWSRRAKSVRARREASRAHTQRARLCMAFESWARDADVCGVTFITERPSRTAWDGSARRNARAIAEIFDGLPLRGAFEFAYNDSCATNTVVYVKMASASASSSAAPETKTKTLMLEREFRSLFAHILGRAGVMRVHETETERVLLTARDFDNGWKHATVM